MCALAFSLDDGVFERLTKTGVAWAYNCFYG
jgi:hypothetical protein